MNISQNSAAELKVALGQMEILQDQPEDNLKAWLHAIEMLGDYLDDLVAALRDNESEEVVTSAQAQIASTLHGMLDRPKEPLGSTDTALCQRIAESCSIRWPISGMRYQNALHDAQDEIEFPETAYDPRQLDQRRVQN